MRQRFLLCITAMMLGGIGGAVGSILGHAGGQRMLFVGGFLGGVLVAPLIGWIAKWRRWVAPDRALWVAVGAAIGFVLAATIAVNTLSSPIGPVLSTTVIGIGAVLGAGRMGQPRPHDA